MTKRTFCTPALPTAELPDKRMTVTAPLVMAALVKHEGEVQPALVLEDRSVVVLSVSQICLLRKLFADWVQLFDADKQPERDSAYTSSVEVA